MKRTLMIMVMAATAACGQSDPVADNAANSAALPAPADANVSNPTGAPPPANSSASAAQGAGTSTTTAAIPAAFHGRWGLTPGDCTSTRGDNKGLLTVNSNELKFYESRAVPSGNVQRSADSFSGDFSFTGEGMTWTKYQALERRGTQLVRTESNPMASFTYARCS
jgi:hypothetical protein